MRRTAILECIGIMPEALRFRVERGIIVAHAGAKFRVGMDALGAGHDFLAAYEKVIGVGETGVGWIGGSVEGPNGAREFVHGEEVGGVFLQDESAEGFFLGSA
jgi:hypothetical protein